MSLPDSQEKWRKPFYHEAKAAESAHYSHNVQNDHLETAKGDHSSRLVGSLT